MNSTSIMEDKRNMIDMAALRQGMDREEYYVAWRAGTEMLADVLTKKGAPKDGVRQAFKDGSCGVKF